MKSSLLEQFIPFEDARNFHTYRLSLFIYGLILTCRAESYLELGSGEGLSLATAGMALRDNCKHKYKLTGVDMKLKRNEHARNLLEKLGIRGEVIDGSAYEYELKDLVDVLFIDVWMRGNQDMINKFAHMVNRAIILHDVTHAGILKFPKEFSVIHIPENCCAVAYKDKIL